jgi:hypothetical protein
MRFILLNLDFQGWSTGASTNWCLFVLVQETPSNLIECTMRLFCCAARLGVIIMNNYEHSFLLLTFKNGEERADYLGRRPFALITPIPRQLDWRIAI